MWMYCFDIIINLGKTKEKEVKTPRLNSSFPPAARLTNMIIHLSLARQCLHSLLAGPELRIQGHERFYHYLYLILLLVIFTIVLYFIYFTVRVAKGWFITHVTSQLAVESCLFYTSNFLQYLFFLFSFYFISLYIVNLP